MISREDFQKKAMEVLDEQKFLEDTRLFLEDDLSEFWVSDGSADLPFDDYLNLLYDKITNG